MNLRRSAVTPLLVLVASLSGGFVPELASAQTPPAGSSADAAELFRQGRLALADKDYPTACARFTASLQIEKAVGTLMSLAECEDASHKLASARSHWMEAADFADVSNDRLHRGDFCRQRFAEIDKRVPRLTLRLPPGLPPQTVVVRDGSPVLAAMLGTAMPIDAGAHFVEVTAPGHAKNIIPVQLDEGESKELTLSLGPESSTMTPSPPASTTTPGEQASVPQGSEQGPISPLATTSPTPSHGLSPVFWAGVAVTGAGVLSGVVFGGLALGKVGSLPGECSGHVCSAGSGRSDYDSANTFATVSNVSFALAGAGAVLGVVGFFFLGDRGASQPSASVGLGPAGVVVRGTF
jgi:hypothetical protein